MSIKLHKAFIEDATFVRDALGAMDIGSFTVQVRITGRTLSDADECKIEYFIDGTWNDTGVKGDSIENCLEEFKRRKGWENQHAPLALAKPRVKTPATEDDDYN